LSAINPHDLSDCFRAYRWSNARHGLRGYPGDAYPQFDWIRSLEDRGARVGVLLDQGITPTDYLREILAWGAGSNDPSMKFEAGLGSVALIEILRQVVASLEDPREALRAALRIPGFGLTYASKLLRFLKPEIHASLDSRIRQALQQNDLLPNIHEYDSSRIDGYVAFQALCTDLCAQLETAGIKRPSCALLPGTTSTGWRVADVEMALFAWADKVSRKSASK